MEKYVLHLAILCSDISDHLPIVVNAGSSLKTKKKENTILKRRFTNDNKLLFLQKLQSTNWDELCDSSSDAECPYNTFLKNSKLMLIASICRVSLVLLMA